MSWCYCNIAAEFKELAGLGIISANLKTNTTFTLTDEGLVMHGPTTGTLSITAYSLLPAPLECPGRAGTSFGWMQKMDCDEFGVITVYFIPNGLSQSYMEGDVTSQISMHTVATKGPYDTFEASAASGPTTPSLTLIHRDGYNLTYTGGPIQVTDRSNKDSTYVSFFGNILPVGSTLYMNNFSWTYDPPDIPRVTYSFLFKYSGQA